MDDVGEAGGVCVEEAAAAASPGSALTRIIAGIESVLVVCEGI